MATHQQAKRSSANGRVTNGTGKVHTPASKRAQLDANSGLFWLVGLGVAGASVAAAIALVGRSRRTGPFRSRPREPSLMGAAARQVGLAMLSVLARRLAERVPLELHVDHEQSRFAATE